MFVYGSFISPRATSSASKVGMDSPAAFLRESSASIAFSRRICAHGGSGQSAHNALCIKSRGIASRALGTKRESSRISISAVRGKHKLVSQLSTSHDCHRMAPTHTLDRSTQPPTTDSHKRPKKVYGSIEEL